MYRKLFLWVLVAGTSASPLNSQCVADMASELAGLRSVEESIVSAVKGTSNGSAEAGYDTTVVKSKINDDGLFIQGIASANAATECLLRRRELFQNSARSFMQGGNSPRISEDELRATLRRAAATAIASHYNATDRVGLIFGFGMSGLLGRDTQTDYKIVSRQFRQIVSIQDGNSVRIDTVQSDTSFIVEDGSTRYTPVVLTGVLARLRSRPAHIRATPSGFVSVVLPTAVYGSVQFAGGSSTSGSLVNGVTLGGGWELVGDVHLLVGISLRREKGLRSDLLRAFDSRGDGMLAVPPGETSESIMGTNTHKSVLVSLALPVALRSMLGGGS